MQKLILNGMKGRKMVPMLIEKGIFKTTALTVDNAETKSLAPSANIRLGARTGSQLRETESTLSPTAITIT